MFTRIIVNLKRRINLNRYTAILLLLLMVTFSIRLIYLWIYPVFSDEVGSTFAALGICKSGIPQMPTGSIYTRAPFFHYLQAIPVCILGKNLFSIRILSVIGSIIVLLFVYRLSEHIEFRGRRIVGLLSVSVLAVSAIENQWALAGRMYMLFQLLYVMLVYAFYRGFIRGNKKYKYLSFPITVLFILTHKLSIFFLIPLGLALCVMRGLRFLQDKEAWAWVFTTSMFATLVLLPIMGIEIPNQYHNYMATRKAPTLISFQPSFSWLIESGVLSYAFYLERFFPFFLPAYLLGIPWSLQQGRLTRKGILPFFYLITLMSLVLLSLISWHSARYIFPLYPLYVLCSIAVYIEMGQITFKKASVPPKQLIYNISNIIQKFFRIKGDSNRWKLIAFTSMILAIFSIFGLLGVYHGTGFFKEMDSRPTLLNAFTLAYGYNYRNVPYRYRDDKAYKYVKNRMKENDIVISARKGVAYWHLGFLDFTIGQKFVNGEWKPFLQEKDPILGVPIIDKLSELKKIVSKTSGRVWLVADGNYYGKTSDEVQRFVKDNFKIVYDDYDRNSVRIYLHKP